MHVYSAPSGSPSEPDVGGSSVSSRGHAIHVNRLPSPPYVPLKEHWINDPQSSELADVSVRSAVRRTHSQWLPPLTRRYMGGGSSVARGSSLRECCYVRLTPILTTDLAFERKRSRFYCAHYLEHEWG